MKTIKEIRHFHLFCGLGGGAKGFNRGKARVGNMEGKFRCIGGVDVDPASIRDFERLSGTRGTVLDMFDRSQYLAFHGHEPPSTWKEAGPEAIRNAAGGERPHIVFLSAPCKGFSGLLSETKSLTEKYQALNRLTLRGVWLMLEAWADDPPELIVFENVPRIANRGRPLLDRIVALLRSYGYATAETTHDCGEIGGLAQSRKRFLLVARHAEKVPPFLYEPEKRPLRAVGDILGRMPMPGDLRGGPMHRIPRLQWKTWVRLAFVEAGSDWRSLNKLNVVDGRLADYLIVPCTQDGSGPYGVHQLDEPTGTIAGRAGPSNGAYSVADPRFDQSSLWSDGQAYGVRQWDKPMGTIAGQQTPGQGAYSIADPRMPQKDNRQNGMYRVAGWDHPALAVTGANHVAGAAQSIADPRMIGEKHKNVFHIVRWDEYAGTVTSGHGPSSGGGCVADPRPGMQRGKGDNYLTGGHYGVVPWASPCGAVSSAAGLDNGRWSVADPRGPNSEETANPSQFLENAGDFRMPAPADKLVALIQSIVERGIARSQHSNWRPCKACWTRKNISSWTAYRTRLGASASVTPSLPKLPQLLLR
jgi:site-specific DNA-cytosine methylase